MEPIFNIKIGRTSYAKVYTIDTVYTLAYDEGIKGDDKYVDGTGYNCEKRVEFSLR